MIEDQELQSRVNTAKPAAARVYDWYLGGGHNFDADRAFGQQMVETLPMVRECAIANRAFLRRAVSYFAAQGVRQFLDIGSGVPTAGNVHEIAQQHVPEARTVYVDYESVATAHAAMILDEQDPQRAQTDVLQADFRRPDDILQARDTRRLLDFDEPIGLLLVALLPFVGPERDPAGLLQRYREALPAGSYVAMSTISDDGVPEDMVAQVQRFAASYAHTADPVHLRTQGEFGELFAGLDVVEPGVVWAPQWRPDGPVEHEPARAVFLSGAGRVD